MNASVFLSLLLLITTPANTHTELKQYLVSETASGTATGEFVHAMGNRIVRWKDKIYIAYYDAHSEDSWEVKVRAFDHTTGQWFDPVSIGPGADNHGGPSLGIDSQGYLHIIYGPHGGPMKYRRSRAPGDITAWSSEEMFGSEMTYANLRVGPNDRLYAFLREAGKPPYERMLTQYTKDGADAWNGPSPLLRIFQEGRRYGQFPCQLALDNSKGILHLVGKIHEGTEEINGTCWMTGQNQNLLYIRSIDQGTTWQGGSGKAPYTKDTGEVIESIRNHGKTTSKAGYVEPLGIFLNAEGKPTVYYITRTEQESKTRTVAATRQANGQWKKTELTSTITRVFGAKWNPLGGNIVKDGKGNLHLALYLVPQKAAYVLEHFNLPTGEVGILELNHDGRLVSGSWIKQPDESMARFLPCLERPPLTGCDENWRPSLIYTEGSMGGMKGAEQTSINNKVWWVQL
ncbi:MAG TPA: BNR-4 repeat-containing protein [archaeon]|nr:BNR-4 repeat-containing protein [archaeon]